MLHTIVGLVIASIMVCNFHWRGSETDAGKFFIREYYFEPSKDNKRLLAINGEKLKTRTPAEGFFRAMNRRIDPKTNMSEEAMKVVIDGMVAQHVAGSVKYAPAGYRKGEYRPQGGNC
jgi:hypothetical protein